MNILQYVFEMKEGFRIPDKKEDFKIPEPKAGESRNEYVSRCMDAIGGENKPHDQLVAICETTYTNK
jgi:hypothetical protein